MISSLFGLFFMGGVLGTVNYIIFFFIMIISSVSLIIDYSKFSSLMVESGQMGGDLFSYIMLILSLFIGIMMMMSFLVHEMKGGIMLTYIFLIIFSMMVFMMCSFLSFYIFFEISLVPMFLYIIMGGVSFDRLEAGLYMLLYTLLVSFPLMLNIFYLESMEGSLFIWGSGGSGEISFFMFMFIMIAFLVKLPMYFFHLWLPKAHVEASVSGSMFLAGVMLKISGYGVIRFMYFLKSMFILYVYVIIILSLLGGLIASIESIHFMDMKILVAYSSVVHMAVMIIGVLTMTYLGIKGGLIMMVSHGVCSSGLFYLVNLLYERSGSRSMFINKGGLMTSSGLTLIWFVLISNNISSPPSINLFSELIIFTSFMSLFFNMVSGMVLLMFFGGIYSIFLYSYTQYGKVSFLLSYKMFIGLRELMAGGVHIIFLNFSFMMMDIY